MLFMYASQNNITLPEHSDELFPLIATQGYLPISVSIFFILGLIAAAYSSADSALTSLTTSFSIDILDIQKRYSKEDQIKKRKQIHVLFSIILAFTIIIFDLISNDSVIKLLFDAAGYTYGPLLGLYAFGLFTKYKIRDKISVYVLILAPILTFALKYSLLYFEASYKIGFELLIINGIISFLGLLLIREKNEK